MVKSLRLLRLSFTIFLMIGQCSCALNYPPKNVSAELFIPNIRGFDEDDAFKISQVLEHHYVASALNTPQNLETCSINAAHKENTKTWIRVTKIREPFDWDHLTARRGVFKPGKDGVSSAGKGGVLFGNGVRLEKADLLSLNFLLSPLQDSRYTWSVPCENVLAECDVENSDPHSLWSSSCDDIKLECGMPDSRELSVAIPYRYVELPELALSAKARELFDDSIKIYTSESGNQDWDPLPDNEEIVIDYDAPFDQSTKRLKIKATRTVELSLTDSMSMAHTRIDHEKRREGYVDIIDLSHLADNDIYIQVVRSLILAQAGNCDAAYTVYKQTLHRISQAKGNGGESDNHAASQRLPRHLRVQWLSNMAHLHGQSGGDISQIISDLHSLAVCSIGEEDCSKHESKCKQNDQMCIADEKLFGLVKKYTVLNKPNLK